RRVHPQGALGEGQAEPPEPPAVRVPGGPGLLVRRARLVPQAELGPGPRAHDPVPQAARRVAATWAAFSPGARTSRTRGSTARPSAGPPGPPPAAARARTRAASAGDERAGGDAAAGLLCGHGAVASEALGHPSHSVDSLERRRVPGAPATRQWEQRFGEHAYVPLGEAALAEALKQAGVTAPSIDVLIVAGPHARSNKRVAASAGVKKEAIADDLAASVGNTGAAH